jgi:hypothetical protein
VVGGKDFFELRKLSEFCQHADLLNHSSWVPLLAFVTRGCEIRIGRSSALHGLRGMYAEPHSFGCFGFLFLRHAPPSPCPLSHRYRQGGFTLSAKDAPLALCGFSRQAASGLLRSAPELGAFATLTSRSSQPRCHPLGPVKDHSAAHSDSEQGSHKC